MNEGGVCAAVGGKGFFSLHLRDEGAGLLVALEEALEIARRSQTALQVSHFKASGQANWHLQIKGREKLEQARDEGMDITADIYPYEATNTVLSAVLPDWMKAGGRLALLARLQDAAALENLSQEWGERARDPAVWKEYAICHTFASENGEFEGRRISEICQQRRRTPLEVITRLLLTDVGRTEIMRFCLSVENLEETLRRPWVMIGSDASAKDFSGDWGHPHPRGFGTFPRIIAEFVRKRQILSLPEAVRKMTFLPAQRLGLADRGRIVPGCKADLVIFNAETIADEATYARPLQAPRGISWVIVNGVVAAQAGQPTGARPGKVLRRTE